MRADRGIDPASNVMLLSQRLVKSLPHAMESLEFERCRVVGHGHDSGDGVGVVGGELRIEAVRHPKQLPAQAM